MDHELQTTIRDNLYLRTVPVTTRARRPGETDGLDYTFLSLDQFRQLEKNGSLLERGIYDGTATRRPVSLLIRAELSHQVSRVPSANQDTE